MSLNYILFGIYPYIALSVLVIGSVLRFDREQYTWRTGSSQLLRRRPLRPASQPHPDGAGPHRLHSRPSASHHFLVYLISAL